MSEPKHVMSTPLAHLPAIYQIPVEAEFAQPTEPVEALLRGYEAIISSIDATIDDGAMYLDPLTAPAASATRRVRALASGSAGVPEPSGVATVRTMLIGAKAILTSAGYPPERMRELKILVERSELRLAELVEHRANLDVLMQSAWRLVKEVANRCGPPLSVAASLAVRAGTPPDITVRTMQEILKRAATVQESGRDLSVLIKEAQALLAGATETLAELDKAWSLAEELKNYLPPWEVTYARATREARDGAWQSEPDFLRWLATWVAVDLTEVETSSGVSAEAEKRRLLETRRRHLVREAAVIWRHRGTPHGLEVMLDAFYDAKVKIEEWAWPQGMQIEVGSTIGVDTALLPEADLNHSFVAIWDAAEKPASAPGITDWRLPLRCRDGRRLQIRALTLIDPDASASPGVDASAQLPAFRIKAEKLQRAIDRERPAHTSYYIALDCEAGAKLPDTLEIGVHSEVGAYLLS